MSGYHNVILPGKYSEGSVYAVGFDTRVTELESGQEERMVRYAPGGRRKYQIARGIALAADVSELVRFFIARAGAANAFKFLDVLDHSTTASKRTAPYSSDVPTPFDVNLQKTPDLTYQCVTKYNDNQGYLVTRAVTKLKTDVHPVRVALDGVEIFDPIFVFDAETGIITIDPLAEHSNATWGGDYYTPVRFSQATDEAFRVSMPAAQSTQSLPSVELVEEISPAIVSQDFSYGGAFQQATGFGNQFFRITPVNGRLQSWNPQSTNVLFMMPPLLDMPEGGPIIVIHNASTLNSLKIYTADQVLIYSLSVNQVVEMWVGLIDTGSGSEKAWFAIR